MKNLKSCLQLWLSPILAAISMVAIELANFITTAVAAVKEILGSEETWLYPILTAVLMIALESTSSGTVAVAD